MSEYPFDSGGSPEKKREFTIQRVGGYLHKVAPMVDNTGKVLQYVVSPIMVELRNRDLVQILVGAAILAIPVGFTEETWSLGERLPLGNVIALAGLSLAFIGAYVYFNFYRRMLRDYIWEFAKRVIAIYLLSLLVVGVLLTLIGQAPWEADGLVALKRTVIVGFPASMSAAIADTVK